MRKLFVVAIPLASFLVTVLVIEGIVSVARWEVADRSLVHGLYSRLRETSGERPKTRSTHLPVATRDEIEALIPDMVAAGVGMGNVPYAELATERAAINAIGADGCRAPKPGIHKITTYIRSGDYNRFDPPSLFYDEDAALTAALSEFIDTYGVRKARFTTNAAGERTTLPAVSSADKVLVVGDSVAVGSMIDDAETLSSQLQRTTTAVQYVNLGVNGATAAETACRLSQAGERYAGQISGLIYVYCENDFAASKPYGTPEEVVASLEAFARTHGIARVTVVFAPFVYNIVPNITRFPGTRGDRHDVFAEESARLEAEVRAAGFAFVDIGDIAQAEAKRHGTDFAALSLFIDHVHLSGQGMSLLAKALPID